MSNDRTTIPLALNARWQGGNLAFNLLPLIFVWLASSTILAQPVAELPTARYYAAREMFRMGNVIEAAAGFQEVLNLSQQAGADGGIDSVPTRVMLGECFYYQGELAKALEMYDAALMVMHKYPNWLDQFSLGDNAAMVSEPGHKGVSWFKLSRPTTSLALPPAVQLQLDLAQARTDAQGNVVAPISVAGKLDATEVLRTVGVALSRRVQLLGPLVKYSPLTNPMVQYFTRNLSQPQSWAQTAWLALRGLASLAQDLALGQQQIQSSLYVDQQYDYFLTPLLLKVQADLAASDGQYQTAIVLLQDASLLSAQYLQYDQLSEVLLLLGDCACANERWDLADPLLSATTWCNKKAPLAHMAGMLAAAEIGIHAGRTAPSRKLMSQVATVLKPHRQALPRYQGRLSYNEALLALSESQSAVAWARTADAISQMRGNANSGPLPARVFQLQLTLDLAARGNLTLAEAETALAALLAEPSEADWKLRPCETLAALSTPAVPAYQRWLRLANPDDLVQSLTRIDAVQRRQVFEATPLGGRYLTWKQAAMRPVDTLPQDVLASMQLAVQRYPALGALPAQLANAVKEVRQFPFQLDERQIKTDQKQAYVQMVELSEQLEMQLLARSLSRFPLRSYFPGTFDLARTQQMLGDGDVLVGFSHLGDHIIAAAVSKTDTRVWDVPDAAALAARLDMLYRQMGLVRAANMKPNVGVTSPTAEWRNTAAELYSQLFEADAAVDQMVQSASRLIVVPHGSLWYLPFEVLIGPSRQPLIAKASICYVPTMGSAEFAFAPKLPIDTSVLVHSSGFFSLDRAENLSDVTAVAEAGAKSTLIALDHKQPWPSSLWVRPRIDELITLMPMEASGDLSGLRALPIDNQPQNGIGNWISSALPTPNLLWLPSLETSIRSGQYGNGNDIFLPVCSMVYGGSTGVLSRWAVGGDSSSRFLQRARMEVQQGNSTSGALRRAALALWAEQFTTSNEPILLPAGADADVLTSGEHPLFWSGYISVGDRRPN